MPVPINVEEKPTEPETKQDEGKKKTKRNETKKGQKKKKTGMWKEEREDAREREILVEEIGLGADRPQGRKKKRRSE